MKKGLLLLSFIICALAGISQTPNGLPSPNSTGFAKYNFVKNDSAGIAALRDTSWSPRYAGSWVYWQNSGVDSAFWVFNGKTTGRRWQKVVMVSSSTGGYVLYTDTSAMLSGYKTYYPRAAISGSSVTGILYNNNTGVISGDTIVLATRLRVQKGIDSLGQLKKNISDTGYVGGYTTRERTKQQIDSLGSVVSSKLSYADTGRTVIALATGGSLNKVKDSLAALISAGGFGTVLSVSTTDGVGIFSSVASPTANPNISIRVDTNTIATRLRVQKGIDSLGVLITTGDAAKLNISDTAAMLTPNYRRTITKITNSDLLNSTISGTALGSNLPALSFGTYLQNSATSYNGTTANTISTNATSSNTGSTLVARDVNGDFSARNITGALLGNASSASTVNITNDNSTNATMYPLWSAASSGTNSPKVSSTKITFNPSTGVLTSNFTGALTGNATTASTLQTPRTINGVAFDGSANISISASVDSSLSAGYGITGSPFNGSLGRTWVVDTTKIIPYTDTLASYGIASKTYVNTKQGKFMVNVADFGAIPNDGTNDATAIRNAINFAYNNGFSTVFFPAGVYTSTEDSIGIRSGIRYLGYNATIQQATSNTCIFLAYPNAVSNVVFEGLTLLGKGTDYNGTDSYTPFRPTGILISSSDTSKNIKILNCTIRNFAYSGVTFVTARDIWVENNKIVGYSGVAANDIKNFGVDINNGNRRVTVIGNHIDSVAQGILVQGNVWEYSLIGNVITNVIGQHGIYVSSGWNSVIQGNTIKNTVANGILLQLTSGQLRGIENMVVNGNTIDSAGGYGIYAYRISGTGLLRNISITNNIIRGKLQTTGAGIELSYCEGGTVSGNYTNGYAYSLLMQSDKYINVSNHAGYNSNESGLYIMADTTRHLTFNNVRFINPSRGGSNAWGISANAGAYLTFNNAFVSDSTATMTYSLYIQPNVDQATVRVTNSTFLNAPVRFESSKAIGEYNSNIAASYYNSPSSITTSRISVNGNYPDKSNAITISVGSGTVTSVATNTGSGITGGTITTSGTIAADTTILSTKANVTALLLGKLGLTGGSSITTVGTLSSGAVPYSLLTGTVPTWNQNTTGSAATSAAATVNYFSIIGSFPYLFLRNTNTATEDYYIQGSINSSQSSYGNYLGVFLPSGKEFFVNKYITSSTGFKILGGTSSQYLMADGSTSTLSGSYVPYTGATNNVALDANSLSFTTGQISLSTGNYSTNISQYQLRFTDNNTGFYTELQKRNASGYNIAYLQDKTYTLADSAYTNSGSYTPTFTNTTNVSGTTISNASYSRMGNIVTVSIGCSFTPTANSTNTVITFTLPVTTATGTQVYVGSGTNFGNGSSSLSSAGIVNIASTTTGNFTFYSTSTSTSNANFTFQYKIN